MGTNNNGKRKEKKHFYSVFAYTQWRSAYSTEFIGCMLQLANKGILIQPRDGNFRPSLQESLHFKL